VAAFNAALDGVELGPAGSEGSLVAASGSFSVRQVITGVPPEGRTLHTTLVVDAGTAHLTLADPGADDREGDPNVVVLLPYEMAAAVSRGEVHPTAALGTGEIRVRGDLAVLVAGQALLGAAAAQLGDLQQATTY
jgi:hypothetical protein